MMYQPLVDPEDFDVLEAKPIIIIHAPGADYDPTEGRCKIRDGVIVCDDCGAPADTVHFVPWIVAHLGGTIEIRAACPDHDPGGYWLPLP